MNRCPAGFAYWSVSRRCERLENMPGCEMPQYNIKSSIPVELMNLGYRASQESQNLRLSANQSLIHRTHLMSAIITILCQSLSFRGNLILSSISFILFVLCKNSFGWCIFISNLKGDKNFSIGYFHTPTDNISNFFHIITFLSRTQSISCSSQQKTLRAKSQEQEKMNR